MGDFDNPEYLYDRVSIVRATRMPCPVCGHPTGDCATSTSEPHHIIGVGLFKSLDKKLEVTVEKDIYEDRQINQFYKTRVVIARAGQKISVDKARELGLL